MEIEAPIYHWTPEGMREHEPMPTMMGYIPVREVEELLREVHRRAQMQGYDYGVSEVRRSA